MDHVQITHPSNAEQAKMFTAPMNLSFDEKANGVVANGDHASSAAPAVATPAATPAATSGASGIVPTLQNIVATVNLDCRLDLKTIALHVGFLALARQRTHLLTCQGPQR